nr:hypothetical protein [Tanacetum cinerariifolium]
MNQNFLKPNPCYEPNSSSFDQYQPLQSFVTQQIPQRSNEVIQLEMEKQIKNNRIFLNNNIFPYEEASMEVLLAKERILKLIQAWDDKQVESWSLPELLPQLLKDSRSIDEMLKQREQAANLAVQKKKKELAEYINSSSWNHYNNDEENSIQYKEYLENSFNEIAPVLPTEEPEYSLSMRYEHLSTISETESDEVIKSSAKNLVQIPSDDDELLSNKDVPMENFKVYSNSLFDDEEINSNKEDPHYFNTKSDLIESLSNRDTLFNSSPKFDYLEEFSGELMPTSIVNEERIKREHEEYIILMEKLLAIKSFHRSLENFHANMIIETLPTSTIPVEYGDSLREEIALLSDDSIPLLENESSNFDHHDDPSFPRPPPEPPDVELVLKVFLLLIHNSILNGPYVRKMIPKPGDANRDITVTETFHLQTDDELSDKEIKQIEANDQAIQTILVGLPEDIYAAVDSCKTA